MHDTPYFKYKRGHLWYKSIHKQIMIKVLNRLSNGSQTMTDHRPSYQKNPLECKSINYTNEEIKFS